MHWTFRDDKTKIPQPDEYFGFVYVITNKLTTKQYIGCKQYWQMRKKKKHKPSSWRVYTSSSKYLNEDIDKIGKRRFKFEIIQEYKTKRGLHYYEQYYQMKYHVLTAVIEGTDEPAYYNKNIGGIRFYVPLEVYEDPAVIKKKSEASLRNWANPEFRKKLSKSQSNGPYRITFDTGREIIVDSMSGWAKSNGYVHANLSHMARGKPQVQKDRHGKPYKFKRAKHKDIVKVERLSDEEVERLSDEEKE